MRKVISHILKELGYENVTQAYDGKHALQLVVSGKYDLVVSDWHMPNLTGLELLKEIRKTEKIKDLPVVLITGDNEKGNVMEAIKAGVSSFIIKPFSPSEIEKKLSKLFPKPTEQEDENTDKAQ